jgi:hypothetical protein
MIGYFGPYLPNATAVVVEDPYIRANHRIVQHLSQPQPGAAKLLIQNR